MGFVDLEERRRGAFLEDVDLSSEDDGWDEEQEIDLVAFVDLVWVVVWRDTRNICSAILCTMRLGQCYISW